MALIVDDSKGGTSTAPTGGSYTYVNGKMVWVPKVTSTTPIVKPPVVSAPIVKPSSTTVSQYADTGTGTNPPAPAPIIKPPVVSAPVVSAPPLPSQNAGMPASAATPPMTNYVPTPPTSNGYIKGEVPTQAELDAIVASLRAHAADMWTYEGAIEAGITPKDAARIKNQIPFAEIMANDLPKHDSYTYTPSGAIASGNNNTGSNTGGNVGYASTPAEQESGDLVLEQPKLDDISWDEKYHVEGAPDWWRGMIPTRYDPQSEYASMLNSMIPFMSPEDQRYTASVLYRLYPQFFSSYSSFAANETVPQAPSELTTEQRQYMGSYQRAQAILDTLNKVKQVSGNPTLGPGYSYLQELGSVLRDYSARNAGDSQTRSQYRQMMGALDPLVAEGQQENLSAFSALTRMLAQPYYTAGQVHPTTTLQDNSVISGTPIKNYF